MKTCTKCNQTKPFDCFHIGKAYADGYRTICKACVSLANTGKTSETMARLKELRLLRKQQKEQNMLRKIAHMETQIEHANKTLAPSYPAFLDTIEVSEGWTRSKLMALSTGELMAVLDPMQPEEEDAFRLQFGIRFDSDDRPYFK